MLQENYVPTRGSDAQEFQPQTGNPQNIADYGQPAKADLQNPATIDIHSENIHIRVASSGVGKVQGASVQSPAGSSGGFFGLLLIASVVCLATATCLAVFVWGRKVAWSRVRK